MSIALFLLSAAFAEPVAAGGGWVTFDRKNHCAAVARSNLKAREGRPQAHVTISFDRNGPRRGEVSFRLKGAARKGSQAMLKIGGKPFLLETRGGRAWSRDHAQTDAILDAMRNASGMRLASRGSGGQRLVSRYGLAGAPAAIDAAAACAASQ